MSDEDGNSVEQRELRKRQEQAIAQLNETELREIKFLKEDFEYVLGLVGEVLIDATKREPNLEDKVTVKELRITEDAIYVDKKIRREDVDGAFKTVRWLRITAYDRNMTDCSISFRLNNRSWKELYRREDLVDCLPRAFKMIDYI
jgi:hypothetical protein